MKNKYKNLIKAISFTLIFVFVFCIVSTIFTVSSEDVEYQWMSGIYEEPENSLDAVYIGSSNCYAFWNPNIAWEEYGIAVYPYCCSTQPLLATEYLIKEARKTQPHAVYIVNINTLGDAVSDVVIHRLLDFMPVSKNKLEFANYLFDIANLSFSERLEYYFPIIKYHSKWNELSASNFSTAINDIKGGNTYPWYFGNVKDISEDYKTSTEAQNISEVLETSLESLLDYCDKEDVKIVFVTVPRAESSEDTVQKINTVNNLITERGYPVVDLMEQTDLLGIDTTTDYYNNTHTNIHGAIKFTYYISDYLIQNYDFKDKRTNQEYSSWNDSYEKYADAIAPYVLDIELDAKHRDFTLEAPANLEVDSESQSVMVWWEPVDNADGYTVYRKTEGGAWSAVDSTTETYYHDWNIEPEQMYSYTVVPYRMENGEKMYGHYLYNGIEVGR